MQPVSVNLRPDLLTCLFDGASAHPCASSSNFPHLPSFLKLLQNRHVLLIFTCSIPCAGHNKWPLNVQKWPEFGFVLRATTTDTFSTCQLPKMCRTCVLHMLTSKCASCQNVRCSFLHVFISKCVSCRNRVHVLNI